MACSPPIGETPRGQLPKPTARAVVFGVRADGVRPSHTDDLGLTWLYADEAQATWKPTLGSFTARGRPTDYKNRLMNG